MKAKHIVLSLATLFLSAFALNTLANESLHTAKVHADGEWETIETRALPDNGTFMCDGTDSYLFFTLSVNDYGTMANNHAHVLTVPYYRTSDYNFGTYIQLSNDGVNYVDFSTALHTTDVNYFFKDGTFRFGLARGESVREKATYKFIKVLEGCEFPSYTYCSTNGTKTKYVQSETTISKLQSVREYSAAATTKYRDTTGVRMVTYTGIAAGWNNRGSGDYRDLILQFGQHGVDYLSDDHTANATNRATKGYEIGQELTINGLPLYKIHDKFASTSVDYAHGFAYLHICYPAEVLLMTKTNLVPTLHISYGTDFMDVQLPEVTLKFIGGSWIASTAGDFTLDNPADIDTYSLVSIPHEFGNQSHAVLNNLPSGGIKLGFTINTGNTDSFSGGDVLLFDGMYHVLVAFYPGSGIINLTDKDNSNTIVQQFNGLIISPNTNYLFEFEIVCGETTSFKCAINHLLVLNYTFSNNKGGSCSMWCLDTSGKMSLDYYQELEAYRPIMGYGGTAYYDFMEGDPVYNFAGVINPTDLYDDNVSYANLSFEYEEGAVTNGKYNAGVWTLTITLTVDGYESVTMTVIINVHGTTSIAKIYYDDADPVEVPVGSLLVPPTNPATYTDGDYDYVFDGWYFEGAKWDFEHDVVQGDMHLVSHFKQVPHRYVVTVTFEGIDRSQETYTLAKGTALPFNVFELDGATFEVYQGGNKITSLVVQGDVSITVKYTVVYTYVPAKEPTCTEDGNVGYWYSPVYGNYYFADPEGREIIPDAIIPKLNHDIIHLDYQDSSCHEVGHIDCYYCRNCHKHFSDLEGHNEIDNWMIEKKPHVMTHHDYVAPTCEEVGYLEHWTCANEPSVYYGDAQGDTTLDNIIIPATGHSYLAPTYTWIETDGGYTCKAAIVCEHCHDEISETKVATKVVLKEASCSQEGQTSYSVRFDDPRFVSQNKTVITPKTPHNYVHFDQIEATQERSGVKEHYECSLCHACFIKDGENYTEVQYIDLLLKYEAKKSSLGCNGSMATPSLIVLISAGALSVLLMLRRKEGR